jgi:hypothetical protein
MIKNHLERDKNNPYTPNGTLNLMCTLDKCIWIGVKSTLTSRLKAFLSCLNYKSRTCFTTFRSVKLL